ncbi:TPA: hypothetical protein DDW35_01580 [Candidatus Sumerlaeota bacterium]|nr:hypothetical protein [Candidatus Sumerlaeota bacterium]
MPYQQGTASGYLDLLSQLCTFLSSSTIMGTQAWTVLQNTTSTFTADGEVYLKGPGLNGNDGIYVTIKTYSVSASGIYQWILQGAVGYNANLAYNAQAGCIPPASLSAPRVPLLNSNMPYVFVANGRRFIVVACAGTVVESCCCGWITQYGPSGRWPEPLFIGGMTTSATVIPADTGAFVVDAGLRRLFYLLTTASSAAYLRGSDGTWKRLRIYSWGNYTGNMTPFFCVWPQSAMQATNLMAPCVDGNYLMQQSQIVANENQTHVLLGKMDGVFWVTGYAAGGSLSVGDIITQNGINYYVINNTYRTGVDDFSAIALE